MRNADRSIGRWSFALWLLLCFFLALAVSGNLSANETSSVTLQNSISSKVNSLRANLQRLGEVVKDLKLESEKALLKQQSLEIRLETSLQDSTKLTSLLEQSEETSTGLSQDFDNYRLAVKPQIRRLNIERWIYRGVIVAVAAFEFWRAFKSP